MHNSPVYHSFITQKQPSQVYEITFASVSLPADFPLFSVRQRDHGDAPIRRLHLHDYLEIGFCHAGSGIFVVGEKVLPFRAGDLTVISENEPHYARSAMGTTSDWTWLWLDPTRLLGRLNPGAAWLSLPTLTGRSFTNVFTREERELLPGLMTSLLNELEEQAEGWQDAARGLLAALFCYIHRRCPQKSEVGPSVGLSRLGPALDFLATHYATEISPDRLARLCGMSVTHFRRQFRRVFGKPPHRYLLELRVHAAAAALRDDRKRIGEVAFDAGFATLSTFNRAFQSILGESPRNWRKL